MNNYMPTNLDDIGGINFWKHTNKPRLNLEVIENLDRQITSKETKSE